MGFSLRSSTSFQSAEEFVSSLLECAGVRINGYRPCDIRVLDKSFYERVLAGGSLALGESYVEGAWECEDLSQFFYLVLRARLDESVNPWAYVLQNFRARLVNLQSYRKAFEVGQAHYDLGNDLYRAMLDRRMVYTCAYWKDAETLDEAQEAKLDLVCRKLSLEPGMRVLDIGCGWGSFLKYAAERYGAIGTGITVSNEQARLAKESCQGLDIRILVQDYRELFGKFDRIVSLGMFEHVGERNYRTYFEVASERLKHDGLFLLHTIGGNKSEFTSDPWIEKHIFPNSMIPSITQIGRAIEGLFVMEDWHSFGVDYDRTLLAWQANFKRNWQELSTRYDQAFYRKWTYYLLSCAGSFRARKNQLWQVVLSKNGLLGGYAGVR
ncbi:MAG: cyclopropane fatty acyl phospholipid synthase [Oligoflexia bacterium]|nr:cyclopropane fatty acyl phospholipid synthase [Oligoflexia bacterium]